MNTDMKLTQKISAASLATLGYLTIAFPAFADTIVNPCTSLANANFCPSDGSVVSGLIGRAIYAIFILAAVIALFFLIWGGIKWILSGGDKGKVEAARGTIIAAIVGLIIVFLAFFIIQFVLGLFGLNLNSLTIPNLIGP